ncbi:MAG: nucleoside recognition, partial [Bacteroidetes bacterium]
MTLFIAMLLIAFVIIILLMPPSRVIYIRLLSVPALCILFVICLILLSDTAVKAAMDGLRLWAGVVVPSLFPFFVAAEIMNSTGFIRASGLLLEPVMRPFFNVPGIGSFALAMGVTSGYPVGAKITSDFRKNGVLTKTEAERLMAFTNNSGPLFIVGAVGTGMYGSPRLGLFLFFCHFLACITVGFIFRFYKYSERPCYVKGRSINPFIAFRKKLLNDNKNCKLNFGTVLGDAISNSVSTIMTIGGFIVLFSVIIHLLTNTGIIGALADVSSHVLSPFGVDNTIIRGVLSGLFEITTGSGLVSAASSI